MPAPMAMSIDVDIVGPKGVDELDGTVVVIDVLRAFTTAAYAFDAGVAEIVLVETIPDAFALRERWPTAVLVGEQGGYPVEGFDLCNSPFEVVNSEVDGRKIILRTTAGTRAAAQARRAQNVLVASFVCAEATAQHLLRMAPPPRHVDLVISALDYPVGGDDDRACADYLAARLRAERPPPAPFLTRVRDSRGGKRFLDPAQTDFRVEDLELALE